MACFTNGLVYDFLNMIKTCERMCAGAIHASIDMKFVRVVKLKLAIIMYLHDSSISPPLTP